MEVIDCLIILMRLLLILIILNLVLFMLDDDIHIDINIDEIDHNQHIDIDDIVLDGKIY